MTGLEQAVAAAERGDWVEVLGALRAAWRAHPHPAISKLAWHVLRHFAAPAPIFEGLERQTEAEWLKRAATNDPSHLPQLVATPWPRLSSQAKTRVLALANMPADAILGGYYREFIREPPYKSLKGQSIMRLALKQLAARRDPLFTEVMAEYRVLLGGNAGPTLEKLGPFEAKPLSAEEARWVEELKARSKPKRVDLGALWHTVYTAPDDDGARAVLADALSEAGDVRGEFITLQLGANRQKWARRESELLRTHGPAWLGDLKPHVEVPAYVPWGEVFRRGFPAQVMLTTERRLSSDVFARTEAWATIEKLILSPDFVFAPHPHLRGLKRLIGLGLQSGAPLDPLDEVVVLARQPIERIHLTAVETFGLSLPFEDMRTDRLTTAVERAAAQPWFKTVRRLRIPGGMRDVDIADELLRRHQGLDLVECDWSLTSLRWPMSSGWKLQLTRTRELHFNWMGRNWSGEPAEAVAEVLTEQRLSGLRAVRLTQTSKFPAEQRRLVMARVKAAVARKSQSLSVDVLGEQV